MGIYIGSDSGSKRRQLLQLSFGDWLLNQRTQYSDHFLRLLGAACPSAIQAGMQYVHQTQGIEMNGNRRNVAMAVDAFFVCK